MTKRTLSGIMLTLLLLGMFTFAFNIQQAKASGTIYIRADGSIDPPTAPIQRDGGIYTFTDNIYDSIVVERNNIIIDGNGYTLQGTGSGTGIRLAGRTGVTVRNTQITNFRIGIELYDSSYNSIYESNITANGDGILVWFYSKYNNVSDNNITANSDNGIGLAFDSNYNNISGNIFFKDGLIIFDSYGNVVVGNLVNGKPLVYLEGVSDYTVDNAGQVVLVNCNNILVENLNLSHTSVGVELCRTSNTNISGNNVTNNGEGILLYFSSNNSISGNNIANNGKGVYLMFSSGDSISENNITNNSWGIGFESSSNNVLNGNNITNNGEGIRLRYSSGNIIGENNVVNNPKGIALSESSNNKFWHNSFINNTQQVSIAQPSYANTWDDGYPSGGNYWTDYTGVDYYNGPKQDVLESDGIGDTPYVIDVKNVDHYPLMNPYGAPRPPTYALTITAAVGGTTNPAPGTHSYVVNSTVQVTAIPAANYLFDYWELDGVDMDSANPYTVTMDKNHTLKAFFSRFQIDIYPKALNLRSKDGWITAYIELPDGYDLSDINISSILLNDTIPAELEPTVIGDHDGDGIQDLMVYFNRTQLIAYMLSKGIEYGNVTLALSGRLLGRLVRNTLFIGYVTVRVSTLSGDVNCDGIVSIYDIVAAASSYGTREDEPNWNSNANFAPPWNRIDIFDLVTIAYNYGKTYP